jgi:DNA repair exonuclease SbcCD ATPase subunit
MKVLNYEAHHVLGVTDIRFDLAGSHLYLVGGRNGQGKSSALNALLMALCGRSGMDWPEMGLKDGEKEGRVTVQLSGSDELHEPERLTVELLLRRKRSGQVVEEFRILDSAGEEAPEPRTLLKRLYAMKAFDPLAFERMDRKGKKALLEKLLGLDFTKENAQHKRLYEERTRVNREGTKFKSQFEALPKHRDVPAEEVSVTALMEELDRRAKVNKANATKRKDLLSANKSLDANGKLIEETKAKITELQRVLFELNQDRERMAKEAAALDAEVLILTDEDEAAVREQIRGADAINRQVRDNQKWKAAKESLDALRKQSEELGDALKAIEEAKEMAIREAKWPVEGLRFDEEGVLFDGRPFEQSSKSQRVLASVKIGMALNPELRLLVCQDGSDLDTDTLTALEEVLKASDFQLLLEMVTRTTEDEQRCAVVIQNGTLKPA